jgi:hypothetical protein
MFDTPSLQQYYETAKQYDLFVLLAVVMAGAGAYVYSAAPVKIPNFPMWLSRFPIKIPNFPMWLLAVVAPLVRLPMLSDSFWYDETFSGAVVKVDWSHFLTAVSGDVHPPTYYALLKVVSDLLGYSELSLRLPAFVFGLGFVGMMYLIGKQYGGQKIGLLTAWIVALLPATIYYSAEARYPMFMAFWGAVAFWSAQTSRPRLFAAALTLASMSHSNGLFYAVAMIPVVLISKRFSKRWIVACGVPLAAIAAWLPSAVQQARIVAGGFWLPLQSPLNHVADMAIMPQFLSPALALAGIVAVWLLVLLALWHWRKADLLWLAVVIGVPAGQWLMSVAWNPIYLPRTLLFPTALLAIPVAAWLIEVPRRWPVRGAAVALAICTISIWGIERSSFADVVAMCGGRDVYATNTHTGILAKHYALVSFVYPHGDSIAQTLTDTSKNVLLNVVDFDDVDDKNVCVVSQFSAANSDAEYRLIQRIFDLANQKTQ